MSFGINVKGGTGAGNKKPLGDKYPVNWMCQSCQVVQPSYARRCLTSRCNVARPMIAIRDRDPGDET